MTTRNTPIPVNENCQQISLFNFTVEHGLIESSGLEIFIAESQHDKKIADNFVIKHHSYVASAKTVGRCIKYLILYKGNIVGTFWLGSGFRPTPKAILNYLGVSQTQFDLIFNEIADNKRFCLISPFPNSGSIILSKIRKRSKKDWFERYGNNLQAIVTTIGGDKRGSVYKADNWICIGETSGLPTERKSVSMKWDDAETIKSRFVKPTGENRKKIFITNRIG